MAALIDLGPEPNWRDYDKSALKEYRDIMQGKMMLKNACPHVQSYFELSLFRMAVEICEMKTREERRATIASVPVTFRNELTERVKDVWSRLRS